jgi:tRNA-specific 2-thiouridylase
MSGGVDSSVAAALLVEAGGPVFGVTMLLDESTENGAVRAAREVCRQLGIEHHVVDCCEVLEQEVLLPSWREYERGRTPNPCVLCNPRVKLGRLADEARVLGAEGIATGHHARLERIDGKARLLRGADVDKDQSYFLYGLSEEQRERTILPVGPLRKAEVRARARSLGLSSAEAPESQDLCLAAPGRRGLAEQLRQRFGGVARRGLVLDPEGRVVGEHDGIHRYTVGQRRGLGVALGRRAWAQRIDCEKAEIVMTAREEDLLSTEVSASGVLWHVALPGAPLRCEAQIRYRHRAAGAAVEALDGGRARLRFDEPQHAVTPGQSLVFYDGDLVLGGGVIESC